MKIRKKKLYLFFCFLVLISISMVRSVFAEDLNYKIWEQYNNVSPSKIWKITFNNLLDESTIKSNIKVVENDTNKNINFNIEYDNKNKYLLIKPSAEYDYGKRYSIIIENGLRSKKGKALSKGVLCYFIIQEENYNSNISLIKEKFIDPGNVVNNPKEFYNVLRYSLSEFKPKIVLNITKYNPRDYGLKIINNILKDNPTLDYGYRGARGNISGISSSQKVIMTINFRYDFSMEKMQNMKKASQEKTKEIIRKIIKPGMKDYEKELVIHDYIINNAEYDKRIFDGTMPNESYCDYGVIVKGVGVCDSYARAMYRLLNSAGVEALYVVGDAYDEKGTTPHAWNIVKIDNEYYQVDATWDDPITDSKNPVLSHDYFNLTDDELSENHTWDKNKYPKCNSDKYSFNNI